MRSPAQAMRQKIIWRDASFHARTVARPESPLRFLRTGGELPDAETRTAWCAIRDDANNAAATLEAISKWVSNAQRVAAELADDFRKNYASRRLPTDPEKFEELSTPSSRKTTTLRSPPFLLCKR